MNGLNNRRLTIFIGFLVGFAGLFILISRLFGVSMIALAPIYMFTPLIAGLVVCFSQEIPLSNIGLRLGRPRWLALSALTGLTMVGATLGLSLAVPGTNFDSTVDPAPGIEVPSGLLGVLAIITLVFIAGMTVNALVAFGEEVGWRGYLLWELAPLGFWRASVLIGAIWGVWHAPIIIEGYNFPSFPIVGIAVMTVACVAFSPLYIYLVMRAETVLAAAFLHGVFNGSAGLILVYTSSDSVVLDELVANPVGLAGVVTFSIVAVGIAVHETPTLDRSFVQSDRDPDRKAEDSI